MARYVVTGGAGFIGSNIVAALAERGAQLVVCDWLGSDERWRNLAKHEIEDVIAPETLLAYLEQHRGEVTAVIHMGAVSATTESNVDLIVARNIRATLDLLQWCSVAQTRLIYASSAATYGDGANGFDDGMEPEALARLRPLNAYGWSKQVVDRRIARLAQERGPLPPQWVGLKFFNVYGPNEYHKGTMQSVIAKNYSYVREDKPMMLFRSYNEAYADGCQLRDFVYIRDCVDVVLWLLDHPAICGVFNVGTGAARTWLDLANALFDAAGKPRKVEFLDMPPLLRARYQYFTEATMQRLRAAGYERPFTSLEEGVADYVRGYLATDDPFR